jgi:hypothetical protein
VARNGNLLCPCVFPSLDPFSPLPPLHGPGATFPGWHGALGADTARVWPPGCFHLLPFSLRNASLSISLLDNYSDFSFGAFFFAIFKNVWTRMCFFFGMAQFFYYRQQNVPLKIIPD